MPTAAELIEFLALRPLPREGGWFRETYRASHIVTGSTGDLRSAGTAIYYLLTPETYSAIHRLPADEVYHFYLGNPVELLLLDPGGSGRLVTLGPDLTEGQVPQFVVPAGVWQGSRVLGRDFALLGTTVAPGFEFSDFEAGSRQELTRQYPAFAESIRRLTADP